MKYANRGVARKECMMTVNTIGGTDRASWYDLYKAVIAVDMICVRNSPAMNGIITGVGKFCFSSATVFGISVHQAASKKKRLREVYEMKGKKSWPLLMSCAR